ncbi:MAG: hypothetical protein WA885_00600 [Phormidesmis sp.]
MAIYSVFKAVITSAALASVTVLAVSCSRSGFILGTNSPEAIANPQADGAIASSPDQLDPTSDSDSPKGIKTNHDIFHSKALEVPAGTPVPAITVRVDDDPVRGWNLYVGTANFEFTPSKVNGESGPSEGHAQLYINDKPMQRIYSNWTHLPELPPGTNEVRVTLNANGYETLTTQGEPIEDSVIVDVYDPSANQ